MRPAARAFAAVLPVVACLLLSGCGDAGTARRSSIATDEGPPELVLRDFDMKEVRASGVRYVLAAGRATYAFNGKTVTGSDVRLAFRDDGAGLRVTAPAVRWDVEKRHASLPDGCRAETADGYTATLPAAELDLSAQILTAGAGSRFAGPGFTVTGSDLVWRWREGKADLKQPKSVIDPGIVAGKRG
jgi:hypothetical protein